MKKTLKTIAIILFAAFFVAQFVRPDQSTPPVVPSQTLESSTEVPENVGKILTHSCSDCHTYNTNYPWYSKVTPFNWLLANHIRDGRLSLNFSVWNTYETTRKRRKLDQICEQITDGEMPLPSYLWIHWSAKLSAADVKVLCDWTDTEKARLAQNQ